MVDMRPISMERVEQIRKQILDTVCSHSLTHEQKVTSLERLAESLIEVIELPDGYLELKEQGIICDLFESNAPPRPRYIVPDYNKLFKSGCSFLQLEPPEDLDEALNVLSIFIRHVPSVTNFPVFIGRLDKLLEPFVLNEDEKTAKKKLQLFMRYVDRTITDSFCHADIGPEASITGRLLLEIEREEPKSVPNLTILYDKNIVDEEFALLAATTALSSAKPSFANYPMFCSEFDSDFALVSCYNGLYIGGGSYTLSRLRLGALAGTARNIEDFWVRLEHAASVMQRYMDARIKFMISKSGFFESNFLAEEGFIDRERFTAMFGIVGLAECVNALMELSGHTYRFGHNEEADAFGLEIMERLDKLVKSHSNEHCEITNSHFLLHGQVGIDLDKGESPAVRIPIGDEPDDLVDHLIHCGKFHGYFPSGTGDVFVVESTAHKNPEYVLDIVNGGFSQGVRYLSIHAGDSDVFRVTGYLVKKSEMEELSKGNNVLRNTTALGLGAARNARVLKRRKR